MYVDVRTAHIKKGVFPKGLSLARRGLSWAVPFFRCLVISIRHHFSLIFLHQVPYLHVFDASKVTEQSHSDFLETRKIFLLVGGRVTSLAISRPISLICNPSCDRDATSIPRGWRSHLRMQVAAHMLAASVSSACIESTMIPVAWTTAALESGCVTSTNDSLPAVILVLLCGLLRNEWIGRTSVPPL